MAYPDAASYPAPSTKPVAAFDDLGREIVRLGELAERLSRLTDTLAGPRPRGLPSDKVTGDGRGLIASRTAEMQSLNERLGDDLRALEALLP